MRIKILIAAALTSLASVATVLPASAAGELCYDVDVNVGGEQVVAEADCVVLP